MISFTSAQLEIWIAAFLWPFSRILALLAAAPVTGNQRFPNRAKIGLAAALTLLVAPTLPPLPSIAPDSAAGLLIIVQQLVIGVAMGLIMRVVFAAVEMAGELIGLQMGLGFAQFYDPQNASQMPVLGQFLGLVATLVFLAINGHLLLLSVLAESFRVMPVGATMVDAGVWKTLAGWGGTIMYAALLLTLPLIGAMLIVNLGLGVLTRAAPQLNLFAVGFPITLAVGFGALLVALPHFTPTFQKLVEEAARYMLHLGG